MEKLRVGFVGLRRGGGLVRALAAHPRVEVAALCDLNEDTLTSMSKDFNLPEKALFTAFDDFVNAPLDVVVIATPSSFTLHNPSPLWKAVNTSYANRPSPTP